MGSSYNDWLKPSDQEIRTIRGIEDLIRSNKFLAVNSALNRLSLDDLIRFTELSSMIASYCDDPAQASLWRKRLGCFTEDIFSIQEHQPLTLSQLIKGYYFFWLAVDCLDKEKEPFTDNELEFLFKSAGQHCFHAYNALIKRSLQSPEEESISVALYYAQRACEYHWTPGYLLLYRCYLAATVQSPVFYQEALEALLIAQKLAEHSDSLSAQNNAYFGKGIIYGNSAHFTSWDEAIDDVASKGNIAVSLRIAAYTKATRISESLLIKDKTEEERELSHRL